MRSPRHGARRTRSAVAAGASRVPVAALCRARAVRSFLAAGIEIHEYRRSFMHAKVAVVDERWSTVALEHRSMSCCSRAKQCRDRRHGLCARTQDELTDAMEKGAHSASRQLEKTTVSVTVLNWICYELVRFLTGWSSYGRRASSDSRRGRARRFARSASSGTGSCCCWRAPLSMLSRACCRA